MGLDGIEFMTGPPTIRRFEKVPPLMEVRRKRNGTLGNAGAVTWDGLKFDRSLVMFCMLFRRKAVGFVASGCWLLGFSPLRIDL